MNNTIKIGPGPAVQKLSHFEVVKKLKFGGNGMETLGAIFLASFPPTEKRLMPSLKKCAGL